tara:strand:+ start:1153 stop:1464 length:312 start_codon:yes stop_codon:yes gene_type:complete
METKKAREEKLKELWYARNPQHELNADTEKDMFWGTVLCVFEDFYKEQTTSQQQTIERLRESLQEVTDSLDLITNGGGHPESKCRAKLDKAKQLLNTTEPIDQ